MRLLPMAAALLGTACAMSVVGGGVSGVGMAGPRAANRIALLVPQIEVTALLLIGLPFWARLLRAERLEAYRAALAITARGRRKAVVDAVGEQLKTVLEMLIAGGLIWILASLLGYAPSILEIAGVRLLLFAFAAFGIGLGVCSSALSRSDAAAFGVCASALFVMAASPLVVAPLIATLGARGALIQASVLLNPWVVTGGLSGLDILRMQWVYALSPLGSLEVSFPTLAVAAALYGGAGLLLAAMAIRLVRPARRAS